MVQRCCLLPPIKQNCLLKTSKNSNLDASGISLPGFLSRTNLKLELMWQQLDLASELEFDLRDTVNWGKKWLVHFSAGKTQLVLFDWSNSNGSIDVKMNAVV